MRLSTWDQSFVPSGGEVCGNKVRVQVPQLFRRKKSWGNRIPHLLYHISSLVWCQTWVISTWAYVKNIVGPCSRKNAKSLAMLSGHVTAPFAVSAQSYGQCVCVSYLRKHPNANKLVPILNIMNYTSHTDTLLKYFWPGVFSCRLGGGQAEVSASLSMSSQPQENSGVPRSARNRINLCQEPTESKGTTCLFWH